MEIFQIIKGSIGETLEIVVIQGPEILDTLHNILRVGMGGEGGYKVVLYMIGHRDVCGRRREFGIAGFRGEGQY